MDGTKFTGVPVGTMAVLMLSVFTVSLGFGIVLPVLPFLIERLLGPDGSATQVGTSINPSTSLA